MQASVFAVTGGAVVGNLMLLLLLCHVQACYGHS
jgi:hypothetical protein